MYDKSVSIPYSTIKIKMRSIEVADKIVSIPYSTIKIIQSGRARDTANWFQFLIVRLKFCIAEETWETGNVSIPYSTIKILYQAAELRTPYSFNSL